MDEKKRNFLKVSGLAALGLAVTSNGIVEALVKDKETKYAYNEEQLHGKRWAMVINIHKCKEDCDDCLAACHRIHNVPDIKEPKREIKWIWKETYHDVFADRNNKYLNEKLQHKKIPVLCNHCDNPPCVQVCPTKATFKKPDGIVAMDFHRCIGCRYCVAACPYGSRSFNWIDPRPYIEDLHADYPTRMMGVVEKCNFCQEELAKGLIPACVEACKHGALMFGDLGDPESEIRKVLEANYTIRRTPQLGTEPQVFYIV